MTSLFGLIGFTNAWALLGLLVIPAIWLLLRVTPPPPRRLVFPALRLFDDLRQTEQTPADTPLWLMILRMILAALIVLGLAGPNLNPRQASGISGPLVLVIDDSFASAIDWQSRLARIDAALVEAEQSARSVMLVTTAINDDPAPFVLRSAEEARALVRTLTPKAWGTDRAWAAKRLTASIKPESGSVFWSSDGLDDPGTKALVDALKPWGKIAFAPGVDDDPIGLSLGRIVDNRPSITIIRTNAQTARNVQLRFIGTGGLLVGRQNIELAAGQQSQSVNIDLATDLANRLTRIELEGGEGSAAHVLLLDERDHRRPVALVSGEAFESAQWLLSDLFYLQRALSPFADINTLALNDALDRKPSVVIMADIGPIKDQLLDQTLTFIKSGGMVVQFAGPKLAGQPDGSDDPLLPVSLRQGGRALGGTMTWERPARLAPFEADSPFVGLSLSEDITVTRQVLADTNMDAATHIWARLDDGTPLVTAKRMGQGWSILFHVTATPDWSNLPLSGLYVDMLRRIIALGRIGAQPGDVAAGGLNVSLKPIASLDGFGALLPPPSTAQPIEVQRLTEVQACPKHPPGFYGEDAKRRAFNLLRPGAHFTPIQVPDGAEIIDPKPAGTFDLAPLLFILALILLMADLGAVLILGRYFTRAKTAAILLAFAIFTGAPVTDGHAAGPDTITPQVAANESRLAYIRTNDGQTDQLSQAGLHGLSEVIARRTAFEPGDPIGLDPERDEMVFYPVIYWPVLPTARALSDKAASRVNAYMKSGGLIIFDTRDGGNAPGQVTQAQARLRVLLQSLDIPPLTRIGPDHVLTKTFYLLQTFPGRWRDGEVWVEAPKNQRKDGRTISGANDGVSPIIIGAQDWAAAWAIDEHDNPMAALIPDDRDQREFAYRFGVNVVMYALTGNYKSDQVHVPALLQRLGQ
jgi:hypothetical protein